MPVSSVLAILSPLLLGLASCSKVPAGDKPDSVQLFTLREIARFNEPWAMAFIPKTPYALITERSGHLKLWQEGGQTRGIEGVPPVDSIGQGGLGDVKLSPDYAASQTIYLSWVEHGESDTRGAVVGRARLVLDSTPRLEDVEMVWRQQPKVTGDGHFSHRIAFSRDGKYLFVSSGERKKFTPAQDLRVNLGKIVRLLPDGRPAPGNPVADKAP